MFPNACVRGVQAKDAWVPVTVIWFVVVVAVPPNVQVRDRVAVFAPAVVGFALTLIVQVALEPARSLVPQPSEESVKSVELSIVGAEHPVAEAVPEFVSVNVWFEELDPTLMFPNAWVRGVQAKDAWVPVTVIWFVVVVAVPPNVHVRDRVAVFAPAVVGLAFTSIVQVALEPARSLVPQPSEESVKSVELSIVGAEHPVAEAEPEFVSVNVVFVELDPTLMFPNACVSGVQAREGSTPVTMIWLVVVEAVPPKLQVRESVVACAPAVAGFPFTVTVHDPVSAIRSEVPQVSAVIVKFVVSVTLGAEQPLADADPVFERVNTWVPESEPTLTFPKSFVMGLHARLGTIEFTVKPFVVVAAVPPPVQVRDRVVDFAPDVWGMARTRTVQVPAAARSDEPQLSVVISKSVEFESVGAEHPVAVLFPAFESVKVLALEAEPELMSP
jgi:hypothetical protein